MTRCFALMLTAFLLSGGAASAGPRAFVGYFPSWIAATPLAATSPVYSHVVLAFARPDFSWNARDWAGTGLQFEAPPEAIRKQIKVLQARGTKVLLAVGGATYGKWSALAAERDKPGPITAAFTRLVADMGFDGLDVDYERDGTSPEIVGEYRAAIAVLRTVAKGRLLTLAAWSTGADCTAVTGFDACGGKVSETGGGRERLVFADKTLLEKIDLVDVMSYDAGVTEFDPVTAWWLYRELLPQRVTVNIGFEIAPEGWGGATLVKDEAAAACVGARIVKDQFGTTVRKPYSVERILRDGPLTNQPHSNVQDGAMLWYTAKTENIPRCGSHVAASPRNVEDAARTLLGR